MNVEDMEAIKETSTENDTEKTTEHVKFAIPKPIAGLKSPFFKKPVLIGPRKGGKKGINDNRQLEKPNPSSDDIKEVEEETSNKLSAEPIVNKILSGPKRISDLSHKVLPAEFPYTEPPWKGMPDDKYLLEELKSGVIEKEIDLCGRTFTVLGRLDHCHIVMAHPTISRYHAVLQYRASRQGIYDKGFYLYDLGSTHGTFLNKNRIKPQTFVRIQVGHVMKFGCSTRLFILQGPSADEEPESEFSLTELKEMRKHKLEERELKKQEEEKLIEQEKIKEREELESKGISWGMGEDADEETDLSENPFAVTTNEELYTDDPKKELKKWFEREGEEMNIETEQVERGQMVCRVSLPLDNGKGGEVIIESTGKSKKEATTTCALEACRYIDRIGLFRQANRESKKRQVRNWEENDFYDSDEDSYFDRTGNIDEKRQKRMKKAGKIQNDVQTYESLMESHKDLLKKIAISEKKFNEMNQAALNGSKMSSAEDVDELDLYMSSLKQNVPNKLDLRMCQTELNSLKEEEKRLVSLINLAKPTSLPELRPYVPSKKQPSSSFKEEPNQDVEEVSSSLNKDMSTDSEKQEEHSEQNKEDKISEFKDKTLPKAVIGPQYLQNQPAEEDSENIKKPKRNRIRQRDRQKGSSSCQLEQDDYNDVVWQPPEGQTGDGRTSLNDKYGY